MLVLSAILTLAMVAVMAYDATRFIIPNWLNLLLLGLYPLWWWLSGGAADTALNAAILFIVLFVGGFGLFAAGIMGGGDVKLLAVLGLYIGWGYNALGWLIYISLLGGALSLLLIAARQLYPKLTARTPPAIFQKKQPVPYGLAIAGGFLIMLWSGRLATF